jgi:hypothetical protein
VAQVTIIPGKSLRVRATVKVALFIYVNVGKIVISFLPEAWQDGTKMNDEFLILTGISEGQKVKLTRLSKSLRQIDLASVAKVNPIDITRLEKGRYVLPTRRKRILAALGMDEKNDFGETI